jgi:hypothetical protein
VAILKSHQIALLATVEPLADTDDGSTEAPISRLDDQARVGRDLSNPVPLFVDRESGRF